MSIQVKAAGLSDVGRLRQDNEDIFLLDEDLGLFAVADGMGGHAAGEVASRLAVEALREVWYEETDGEGRERRMLRGYALANDRIRQEVARNASRQGMGTTLVAILFHDSRALVANVGDSRAYLVREAAIRQVTTDHSWIREQVDQGRISTEEAVRHPFRNVITRALGTRAQVEVDLQEIPLQDGDRLLLCSDGLTGMLKDDKILEIIDGSEEVQAAAEGLVSAANQAGGEDNVTVLLLDCVRGED